MLTEKERLKKIDKASKAYSKFMDIILPGWEKLDKSKDTPMRVSKLFINEFLNKEYGQEPKITVFDNDGPYDGIVSQIGIPLVSICAHHHLPFMGYCHIAYIATPNSKIIGLSKLNRVVKFLSGTTSVQEELTMTIHNKLNELLFGNDGVSVVIEAQHTCVKARGVKDDTTMKTAKFSGNFFSNEKGSRDEFLSYIRDWHNTSR